MSGHALPLRAWRRARVQAVLVLLAFALPWLATSTVAAALLSGRPAAFATALVGALATCGIAALRWQRRDARWLVRTLNARRADMEDSADLLLEPASESPLRQLQRSRLQQRLATAPPDLRTAWPWAALGLSALYALLAVGALMLRPDASPRTPSPDRAAATVANHQPGIASIAVAVSPPAYTRIPGRVENALSLKAPQGSMLRWSLRFSPAPTAVELVFLDGRRLPLAAQGEIWQASLRLDASALYRIRVDGTELDAGKLHRLDAIADAPPQIRVLEPAQSASVATPGQARWTLAFEVSDDYGVAAGAVLRIILVQGCGENIASRSRDIPLDGSGPATRRRFLHALDLAASGAAPGDELIAQLTVNDNRAPQPQVARSPSLLLRIASPLAESGAGVEGIVNRVMPAYFRSQRQIIIDAEALQKRKRGLQAEVFLQRADTIGVDQRILRLRYGQFLGEEANGAHAQALPVADDADTHADAAPDAHADHDATALSAQSASEQQEALLEAFGHTHDIPEAATLLDPQTRATLKQALDQMWQSELALRQGQPDRALPHAYKALAFIKQVQQASRIYLARVGPQLPPIDETRRLGGKREGLDARPDALQPATRNDAEVRALWQALDPARPQPTPAFDAFDGWLRAHPERVGDPLALQEAMDMLRRQPRCTTCRERLRGLLWPLLAPPPARVPRRDAADAQGNRYLDALQAETRR